MTSVRLTPKAITAVTGGDVNMKPLVQIIEITHLHQGDRYRVLISDSVLTQHAILATQLNDKVKTGALRKGSVVQLIEYICNTVQHNGRSRKIILVLNLEIIIPDCGIIGDPKMSVDNDSSSSRVVSEEEQPPRKKPNISTTNSSATMAPTFRPTVQAPYKPPPNYKNHGSIFKNEAPPRIVPISSLNPYQGRWAIKARVTAKSPLRRYNNAKGDGKVFSFDLLDSDGGEIRVTCFNALVDRYYESVKVGSVYLISKGKLKHAQKDFNHLKNEWEIFLEPASTVDLCEEEDGEASIPNQQFFFKAISEIENVQADTVVDVIGVVTTVNPSVPVLRKNGMETQRRNLKLKDQSNCSVDVTLWGDFCNKEGQQLEEIFDSGIFPVLAVKAGKVSDFSGKSISSISATQLFVNPDFPEASTLRKWFDSAGKTSASSSISSDFLSGGPRHEIRKTVSQIKDEGLGRGNKPDWITVKASLTFIKADNFYYTACPIMIGDKPCAKKVVKTDGSAKWRCERCDQKFEECDYRYLLQFQVQDHTGVTWATAFQEAGVDILGCSAKELCELKDDDEDRFAEIISRSLFNQYMFRLRVKEESYGEEQKVKITVLKAEKVNPFSEATYLLDCIQKASL